MFDPRTLPGGDFWPNAGLMFLYASLLADCAVTRYGIWVRGFKEANPLMRWFTKGALQTFVDGGLVRPAITIVAEEVLSHLGVFDNAHAWIPFVLSLPVLLVVGRNLLKLKK